MEFDFASLSSQEKLKIFKYWLHLKDFKEGVNASWESDKDYSEEFIVEFMNSTFMTLVNTIEKFWEWDEDHNLFAYVKDEYIEKMKDAGYEQSELREGISEVEFDEDDDEDEDEPGLIYPEKFYVGGAPYFWMSEIPLPFKKQWFFQKCPTIKEEWLRFDNNFEESIGCGG